MSGFAKVDLLALQQPLIMLASMLTGKPVAEILALEVHERAKLVDSVVGETKDLTAAVVSATDPAGPGGVTLTDVEANQIVAEAADIGTAVKALGAYRAGAGQ